MYKAAIRNNAKRSFEEAKRVSLVKDCLKSSVIAHIPDNLFKHEILGYVKNEVRWFNFVLIYAYHEIPMDEFN